MQGSKTQLPERAERLTYNQEAKMTENRLVTDNGTVFYWKSEDWSDGRDTLFFFHGLTADHTMFDPQVKEMAGEFNLLSWDTPAHGKSRPFSAFSFRDIAEYVGSILDQNGIDKAILVGQSLGGYVAQSFIKRYPDRVKGFVSIDSTPYGFEYYSKFDMWILRQVEWMARLYPVNMMKKAMAKQVSVTQQSYENMMQMLTPYGKEELCHLMGLGYAGFLEDNCEMEISCPVQLILGEKDRTGKVKQYNLHWARKTGYPLKIIKDAAHNVNVDRPEEVNECIRDFVRKINEEKGE